MPNHSVRILTVAIVLRRLIVLIQWLVLQGVVIVIIHMTSLVEARCKGIPINTNLLLMPSWNIVEVLSVPVTVFTDLTLRALA